MTLTEQTTIRFTGLQKEYLQAELARLRGDSTTSAFRWSEADIIRALVENARKSGHHVAATADGASE
jgi:hypothetical protein